MSEAKTESKPPYPDGFVFGRGLDDPEGARWNHEVYATREAAIAESATVYGAEPFQTAAIRCQKQFMQNPLSAESACDSAEDDNFGEGMLEAWQDKVFGNNAVLIDELQETLDKVWSDFEDKHELFSWGIWFDDVENHDVEQVEATA